LKTILDLYVFTCSTLGTNPSLSFSFLGHRSSRAKPSGADQSARYLWQRQFSFSGTGQSARYLWQRRFSFSGTGQSARYLWQRQFSAASTAKLSQGNF
jgi:hypothetical protein